MENIKTTLDYQTLTAFLEQERAMNTKVESGQPKLNHLVNTLMAQKCVSHGATRERDYFWDAAYFGMDQVGMYQAMPEEMKILALKLLTDHNLNEAYYIEKTGMSYAAKMILLSESEEEKALYSSIACDEATHLYEVKNFLNPGLEATYQGNGFLKFIADTAAQGSASICQAVLQVALEGHGMSHYANLRSGCLDPKFKEVLTRILLDEASHHGSGVVISINNQFSDSEKKILTEHMIQLGALLNCTLFPIVMVLEKLTGGLTSDQRTKVFEELNASAINADRLKNYRKLLTISKLDEKIPSTHQDQVFQSWNSQTCNQVFMQMLST